MDKTSIRREKLALRLALSPERSRRYGQAIAAQVRQLVAWETVRQVHAYRSRTDWHEADTAWLVDYLASDWPEIRLTYGDISRTARLPRGRFDLILVPLVAFDAQANRLGLGGGWYDRFLATQPQALVIGLGYELQRMPELPTEPHDLPLDYVVTERDVVCPKRSPRS